MQKTMKTFAAINNRGDYKYLVMMKNLLFH